MKNILLSLALAFSLGSCVSTAPDTLATDGPLGRQVHRVVERHDNYVLADSLISQPQADAFLARSAALEALVGLPEVSRAALKDALLPVADVHDAYVRADAGLDALEQETYLASTEGLRRLAGAK